MNLPKKDESALDSIEHELYDPKAAVGNSEIHKVHSKRELSLPTSWSNEDNQIITKAKDTGGVSFGAKMLLVSVIILFSALAFTAWRVISLRNVVSSANIDMTADITPFIEGGEATPLILTVSNRNLSTLEAVKVTLLYKQGSSAEDEQEKVQEKRDLGDIKSGEFKRQDFSVALYGGEGETRDITLKLEYKVQGSNAIFNKTVTTNVILKTPPISVNVEGPSILSVGQNGKFVFSVKNNSATSSLPGVLQVTLPTSFTISGGSDKPQSKTSSWEIESLPSGGTKEFTITGSLTGKEDEIGTISARVGSVGDSSKTIGVVYASETIDIRLRASPLALSLALFTERGTDTLRYGDKARLELAYKNASVQALEDVSIVLSFEGDAAMYDQINPTSGYYDSTRKVIKWDKATFPDLAVLAPGGEGTLQVFVPIVAKGTSAPKLKVSFVGTGSQKTAADVVSTIDKTWTVQGSATLYARTQYRNSTLTNSGPIPPRANIETTYTASLNVSAQNALSAAKVSFTLPVYVSWRNTSSDPSKVSYDSRTRTVTWNIGSMAEGDSTSAEISLSVKPSQSHVGQSPVITSGIVLDADEAASRAHLKTTLPPLTTKIVGEQWTENPSFVAE